MQINLYLIKLYNFLKYYYIVYSSFIIICILIYFSFISQRRLITFFIILLYIYIYKILMYLILNKYFDKFLIKNKNYLKILTYIYFWLNPILQFLWIIENTIMKKILIKKNNLFIKIIIYIFFLLIINPIKFFFIKFYKVYHKWKYYSFLNNTVLRMVGLIFSTLIFSYIITLLIRYFSLYLFFIGYILIIIILLINEFMLITKDTWLGNILNIEKLSLQSIIGRRSDINLLGQFIASHNVYLLKEYQKIYNLDLVNLLRLDMTWYIIQNYYNLQDKPYYWHLVFIDCTYRGFIPDIFRCIFIKYISKEKEYLQSIFDTGFYTETFNNWLKIQQIYEFRAEIYKLILFLMWDCEIYYGYGIKDKPEEYIYKNIELDFSPSVVIFNHILLHPHEDKYYKVICQKPCSIDFSIIYKINKYNIQLWSYDIIFPDENIFIDKENLEFKEKYLSLFEAENLDAMLRDSYMSYGSGPLENYIDFINNHYIEYSQIDIKNKNEVYKKMLENIENTYLKLKKII